MKQSIFYVNSMGMMCQWKGVILKTTPDSISIQFSKNKASRFNLSDCSFLLVTKKLVPCLGVSIDVVDEMVCFDEAVTQKVVDKTIGNMDLFLKNGKWVKNPNLVEEVLKHHNSKINFVGALVLDLLTGNDDVFYRQREKQLLELDFDLEEMKQEFLSWTKK